MQYLDLDAVAGDAEFVLKLKGKEHKLKVASVKTFMQNMQDMEKLKMNASIMEEMQIAINIVKRAFPTISDEDLDDLTILQIKAISEYAMQSNGEKVETIEQDAEGNEPAVS